MRRFISVCIVAALIPEISCDASDAAEETLPNWIWAGESDATRVTFRKQFQCEGSITESRLQVTADFAAYTVALNGQTIATVDDYGPLLNLDVAAYLKLGENSIVIKAVRSSGPAAVAVQLNVFAGDEVVRIASDAEWQSRPSSAAGDDGWGPAVSAGAVGARFWIDPRRDRINSFDNYEQWRLAKEEATAEPPQVYTRPGFEIELLRKAAAGEGSWVSMAFDPQGRLTIAREDQGLLRMTLNADGTPESVETINDDLKECRGLLYAFGDLYANANNSKGLYRLHDSNGDDQFDDVRLLREFPGGVGHGRNDLALGPDGKIYSIHGDSVQLPQQQMRDLTSPYRDGPRNGNSQPLAQGHVVRTDRDGKNWELVSAGLRNPYGIDFNQNGDLFTYDADAEHDMGAPWYRPTRLHQLTSGADFGWRGLTKQWPPYELDHADNALPTATIGKGSPTAVRFGTNSNFPKPWHNSLYILDWAYGRIVACHLFPRGAGYVCRSETFAKGRPLNVTDLDFGPDGAMYVITGGRKTESSLYRIRWTGEATSELQTPHSIARKTYSEKQRALRRKLEQLHKRVDADVIDEIWPHLSSSDPSIRQAACVALEHQVPGQWQKRALTETDSQTGSVALLCLARSGGAEVASSVTAALNRMPVEELSAYDKLSALQAWALCVTHRGNVDKVALKESQDKLANWLTKETNAAVAFAPTGAGELCGKLSRVVMAIDNSVANADVVKLMKTSTQQEERILFLFLLRDAKIGWRPEDRVAYFETLNELQRTAVGGVGMPEFLQQIRDAAVASLTDSERTRLGTLVNSTVSGEEEVATITRPHVRDWTVDDIDELLESARDQANAERGRELFSAALCSRCHRIGNRGGIVGPDLTSVGGRFSPRDLLVSMLDPSAVVAEKYRNVQVVTKDGKTIVGQVITSGDYRSTTVRIATDPLDRTKVVEIAKSNIEEHQESRISPMPKGLLSTLTAEEIADLLAWLGAGAR